MQKLRVLDLFSGIGGFSLGLEWTGGFETVAFCEIEKYPQEVLRKNFPGVPIYDDIKKLTAERLVSDGIGRIQVITGGYPCQPFSVAGKQKGEKDHRHLWPSMLEIIAQVRPAWVICENVTGHIALGLDTVLLNLETEGYSTRTFIVPACSLNAPHRRERLWIVAHSNNLGGEERHKECEKPDKQKQTNNAVPCSEDVADSDSTGFEQSNETLEGGSSKQSDSSGIQPGENALADSLGSKLERRGEEQILRKPNVQSEPGRSSENFRERWAVEPSVGRVADGIPGRVAKLKALGNAVVPQICMIIGQAILDYEQNEKV